MEKLILEHGVSYLQSLDYESLMRLYSKANEAYHNSANPIMSDKAYDVLYDFVESRYPNAVSVGSPILGRKTKLPFWKPTFVPLAIRFETIVSWLPFIVKLTPVACPCARKLTPLVWLNLRCFPRYSIFLTWFEWSRFGYTENGSPPFSIWANAKVGRKRCGESLWLSRLNFFFRFRKTIWILQAESVVYLRNTNPPSRFTSFSCNRLSSLYS